ncbi:MAG: HAMP domain-containing sensor histidine kinase, partial [Geothrix sp.]|nr:HAMP domain-containing sensor histidine kinase [Geothrix sp.]
GGRVWKIRILEELGNVRRALRKLRIAFFHLVLFSILTSFIGGLILSTKALSPVSNIIGLANEIEASVLSRRLPHPGVDDEIGRLVDTLNHMLARIEASFEAMKRFTSDASHELRSPLATIRNTVDVTLSRPRSGEEKDAALQSIGEEVDRIRTLVDDLLLLARADAGRMVMQMKPVSLAFLLEAQVDAHQARAQARDMRLELGALLPDEILGDERWLLQVVGNLLDNAIKYTPVGGTITVDMARTAEVLRFSVSDTGPGIPEDELERVFERFFRSDPSRSRGHVPGLGLGLAIASWVVQEHLGTIQASNRPEGGATFTVSLPLAQPHT